MKHCLALGALPLLMLTVAPMVQADSYKTVEGIGYGLSPDSRYVVGMASSTGNDSFRSFLYDSSTEELEWKTSYNVNDLSTSGRFIAVNNSGIIAGTVKNPDMRLPEEEEGDFRPSSKVGAARANTGAALNSAAVWRNGKKYVLGTGPYSVDKGDFEYESDGSQAIGISPDGNIVYGQIWKALMPFVGCMWTYNETTDSYDYAEFVLPEGAQLAYPEYVAANGIVVGRASYAEAWDNKFYPCVWTSHDQAEKITIPNVEDYSGGSIASAISPDGKYVGIIASGKIGYLGIYETETKTLKALTLPDRIIECNVSAMDNKGNMAVGLTNMDTWQEELYYYDNTYDTFAPFTFYLDDVSSDYPSTFNKESKVSAISGDGKTILARPGGYSNNSWIINIDNPQLVAANPPAEVKIFHNSPNSVTVSWKGITDLAEGLKLLGYDVYVDGELVETVDTDKIGQQFSIKADADPGMTHYAYIVTSYEKKGVPTSSSRSATASTYVSRNTSVVSYVDFDNSSMDGNGNIIWTDDYWVANRAYGSPTEIIGWHLSANDFENRTPFAVTYSISTMPWSSQFISHFMDAQNEKDFFLNFRYQMRLLNFASQDLTTDTFLIEASEDGENWETLKTINASEVTPIEWHNVQIDLGKEWSGKVFQIRFNANGYGVGQLSWAVDNINITNKLNGDTPTGLIATSCSDKEVALTWNNTVDTHEVSHLCNSGYVWDACIGNEGKPLLVGIKLPKDKMNFYAGQYISSLSTFIFDDPSIETLNPTRAEAIIFEGKNEVARTQFNSEFNDALQSTAWFENPVKIEEGKDYMAAIRIFDTHVDQTPVYYQIDSSAVTGTTDLYSEDEGATWKAAKEVVVTDTNTDGNCIWPIRVNITPEPRTMDDVNPDPSLLYYEVLRNGESISGNIYEPHPAFVDKDPLKKADYQVRAFFNDGSISPASEILTVENTGVFEAPVSTLDVVVDNKSHQIIINGEYASATLINMAGLTVARATSGNISTDGLAAGNYILTCVTESGSEVYRVIVK